MNEQELDPYNKNIFHIPLPIIQFEGSWVKDVIITKWHFYSR